MSEQDQKVFQPQESVGKAHEAPLREGHPPPIWEERGGHPVVASQMQNPVPPPMPQGIGTIGRVASDPMPAGPAPQASGDQD
jgi:hypothetical protein